MTHNGNYAHYATSCCEAVFEAFSPGSTLSASVIVVVSTCFLFGKHEGSVSK